MGKIRKEMLIGKNYYHYYHHNHNNPQIDNNHDDDQPRSPPAEKMRKGMFGATALKQSPAVPKMLPEQHHDDHADADHDNYDDYDDHDHNLFGGRGAKAMYLNLFLLVIGYLIVFHQ